ncbi:MAG: ABC transporter permease [Ignisphaera sp.]|nr:ABC transporter permease [Ignisphaera sp.]MCX8167619.1 ABC transporter permease [Ignisphaera sp.]MDW8086136.1 ABC transporter permease [Ignisphaera sp.]
MHPFAKHLVNRTLVAVATLLIAFNISYLLLRAIPASAVDTMLASIAQLGQRLDPEDYMRMRQTLMELFGLTGSPMDQYIAYLKRFFSLDFGPSFMAFPTPARDIVARFLPWTVGLLLVTTVVSWIAGNMLGVFVSFVRNKRLSRILENTAIVLYPIPYYVLSLALIYIFAFLIPIFSLSPVSVPLIRIASISDVVNVVVYFIRAASLPAISIIIISAFGWWFLSSRTLSISTITEDYVVFAKLRGVDIGRLRGKYVLRSVMVPQVTALALALGTIFSGALVTEYIFAYPGLGSLLYQSIIIGDYPIALSILSLSIMGVIISMWILDTVVYYVLDPRIRYAR